MKLLKKSISLILLLTLTLTLLSGCLKNSDDTINKDKETKNIPETRTETVKEELIENATEDNPEEHDVNKKTKVEQLEELQSIKESISQSSTIYTIDEFGNEVQTDIVYEDSRCVWVDYEEFPEQLIHAFWDMEDEECSVEGIIQEIFSEALFEKELDKDILLEICLNTVYLSQQCNGVQCAAKVYFDKDVSDLTLEECATIAAITQFPTKYDPKIYPDNNKVRRNEILDKMYDLGHITKSQRDEAKKKPVVTTVEKASSYYADAVFEQVINDLVETYGYAYESAVEYLYCGGLKIYSAMDTRIQGIMDDYYAVDENFPIATEVQSAMVIVDPNTGYVMGIVGGRNIDEGSRAINRATKICRQPGSALMPLAVYAPAVEYGLITQQSVVSDKEIIVDGWTPRNDDHAFQGDISVAEALQRSRNVPTVRLLQHLGLDRSFSFLKNNYHISSLLSSKNGLTDKGYASLALGGLTNGVSVLEMTAAYVPFCSGGYYYEPSFYTKVLDADGNTLLERKPKGQAAISKSTAVEMTDMLQRVVTSGTGTGAILNKSMPVAGKTGTTSSNYDRWFVGYTPYYVGAVWYGYDQLKLLSGLKGNPSVQIWKDVMDEIHSTLEVKNFDTLHASSNYLICSDSGMLPNSTCTKLTFGNYTVSEAPTGRCHIHGETDYGKGELVVTTAVEASDE